MTFPYKQAKPGDYLHEEHQTQMVREAGEANAMLNKELKQVLESET
jgi:hypothetical protein